MERNPLFTKERALFYFNKIEYFYKQKAYSQALLEIEKNKDLLGAVLNVGKQLSLNKIYANSIVNVMLDLFETDGNSERFDECFNKYRTTLELHTSPQTYEILQNYFSEKTKSAKLGSKSEKNSINIEDTFGEYVEIVEETTPNLTSTRKKDTKAKSIEEDFLNSIGKPFMVSKELKSEVKAEENTLYGIENDFEAFESIESAKKANAKPIVPVENLAPVETNIPAEPVVQPKPVIDMSHTMVFSHELVTKKKDSSKKKSTVKKDTVKKEIEPSSKKETSSDQSFDYTKNSTSNKSGGKVTELSFDNIEHNIVEPVKKKTVSTKKKKKKKKSKLPVVFFLIFLIILGSGIGVLAVKTNIIPNIISHFNNNETQKEPEQPQTEQPSTPVDPSQDPNTEKDQTTDADSTEPEYILPSDTKSLTTEDLQGLDKSKLRYAINEMYARKGWHFDFGGDYYEYFSKKSWYKPDSSLNSPSDASAKFSEIENVNLATIIKYRDTLS